MRTLYLSKSKCWHSNNCLQFLKHAVPLHHNAANSFANANNYFSLSPHVLIKIIPLLLKNLQTRRVKCLVVVRAPSGPMIKAIYCCNLRSLQSKLPQSFLCASLGVSLVCNKCKCVRNNHYSAQCYKYFTIVLYKILNINTLTCIHIHKTSLK